MLVPKEINMNSDFSVSNDHWMRILLRDLIDERLTTL